MRGEHLGALGLGAGRGEQRGGDLVALRRLRDPARGAQRTALAGVQQRDRHPLGTGAAEELVEQPHGLVVVARELGRPGRPVQVLGAPRACRQLGRPQPVAVRLGVGVHALGRPRRRHRGFEGLLGVARLVPVVGELRGLPGTGQRQREPPVQVEAFARQQVGRHHLGHQPVPQPVALAALVDHDDAVRHRFPQRLQERGRGQPEHVGEQLVPRRARGGRDGPHHLLPVGREHRDAAQHDLAQGGRQPVGVAAEHRAHRLLGDERVARRALPDQLLQVRPARRPFRHELGEHVARQRRQLQRRDLLVAPQLGERHVEVRGGAGRVVAEGGHHQHRLVGEDGDQVGDQVAGGPVGPVQVLDHQQHRAQLGELGDRLVQEVEQPHRRAVAVGRGQPFQPLREQCPDVVVGPRPRRGAQRREHRPERRRVGDVDGAPGEHDGVGPPRLPHELADQPRLADARVAADEDRARLAYAGRTESVRQRGQLARASP